jgi:hypothetical protein
MRDANDCATTVYRILHPEGVALRHDSADAFLAGDAPNVAPATNVCDAPAVDLQSLSRDADDLTIRHGEPPPGVRVHPTSRDYLGTGGKSDPPPGLVLFAVVLKLNDRFKRSE